MQPGRKPAMAYPESGAHANGGGAGGKRIDAPADDDDPRSRSQRPSTLPDVIATLDTRSWGTNLRPWQTVPIEVASVRAEAFRESGFIIIEKAVEANTADTRLHEVNNYRGWVNTNRPRNWRNRMGTRFSLNHEEWKFTIAWQYMLWELLEGKVRRYLDAITTKDGDILIDRLGGDVVEAGCLIPQDWHSDWESAPLPPVAREALVGISICVGDITADMGPIEIIPAHSEASGVTRPPSSGDHAVACVMKKGDVLIRDIRTLHRWGHQRNHERPRPPWAHGAHPSYTNDWRTRTTTRSARGAPTGFA